jgi:AcrR family transcriptional regulator
MTTAIATKAPAPVLRRTQASRRAESETRMLRAASQLIGRKGLQATTLAEIGLLAGYSSGLPVSRYGSKLGLAEALLEDMDRWCQTTFKAATAGRRGLNSLKARVKAYLGGALSIPDGALALQMMRVEIPRTFPSLQSRLDALSQHWRQGIRDDLIDAQNLGEVRSNLDCGVYAELILAAMQGMMTGLVDSDLAGLQKRLPDLLCEMVRKWPAPTPSPGRPRIR